MLKQIFANTIAKKTTVFVAVFVITGILAGHQTNKNLHISKTVSNSTTVEQALNEDHEIETESSSLIKKEREDEQADAQNKSVEENEEVSAEQLNLEISNTENSKEGNQETFEQAVSKHEKPSEDVYSGIYKPNSTHNAEFVYVKEIPLSESLQRYTFDLCKERGLEYELVLAIMWRESRFQIDAVNHNKNGTTDSGIMQINDVNKGWLLEEKGIDNLMDPMQNIDAGTTMLSKFARQHGIHNALIAYQYGESGMQEQLAVGKVTNKNIQILLEKRDYFKSLTQNT